MKFSSTHKGFFNAVDGAYSKVTEREVKDSQITLAKDESALAIDFLGKENILRGKVQSNRESALKTFLLYPTFQQIDLNLIFPKPSRSELRLYLKKESFGPRPNQIWFIFIPRDKNKLCLGMMSEDEWDSIEQLNGSDSQRTSSEQDNSFVIRPAGRHILTVGRDLIQDQYAAIIELVKNAYDADSPDVHIKINASENRDEITIIVEDNGHGMDRDTVITKWLVPSTDDKLRRKSSPGGRVMQGRKGVGRYATSFLGGDLLLESVTGQGEKTEVYVDWTKFAKADYLDQVPISVVSTKTSESSGTRLTITGNKNKGSKDEDSQDYVLNWLPSPVDQNSKRANKSRPPIEILQRELKKLIPPVDPSLFSDVTEDGFSIIVTTNEYVTDIEGQQSIKIEPYPIFDLFDYRISGVIEKNGKNKLTFENQRARNTVTEVFDIDVGDSTECGKLVFDFRVYDRDTAALQQLIERGLKDAQENYLGINETKRLLNEFNGIGVYRGGFRIRPLGDPDYDWLELNKERIQNPGRRIGSDRVIGYVQIQSEEQSRLEEKSARDGLRDNRAYQRLKEIVLQVIGQVETRRYVFLHNSGLRKGSGKVERNLEKLFDLGGLQTRVERELLAAGVDDAVRVNVLNTIVEQQKESNEIVEDIRQIFAIYEGQATLGKIINIVLHEGRKPLSFFRSQSDNIKFWLDDYKQSSNQDSLEEAISLSSEFGVHTKHLSELFRRIDPLAARSAVEKQASIWQIVLIHLFLVFEQTLITDGISTDIQCNSDVEFTGWPVDIQIILTNLIENSIFWITEKKSVTKKITVVVYNSNSKFLYLDYRDTGPGIEPTLIENEIIFDPEFSTKPGGTGLGLAIAGESALRNGLELKACAADTGAYFRLSYREENIE